MHNPEPPKPTDHGRVASASLAIARILAQLERDTGDTVERIELLFTDVTKLGDARQMHAVNVAITMSLRPGRDWAVGGE